MELSLASRVALFLTGVMPGRQRAEIKTLARTTQKDGWWVLVFCLFIFFFLQHWTRSIVANSVTEVTVSLTRE